MAGDFREFFDLRKLDERQLGEIEFVLNSPAYEHSFKPYIQGVLHTMNNMWRDRSKKRSDVYPDDFLAGAATFGEGMLKFFDLLIQETNMERIHSAMEKLDSERLYDVARESGRVKPVVGLDQPAMPEPPPDPASEDY